MKNRIFLLLLISFSFLGNVSRAQCPMVLYSYGASVTCSSGEVSMSIMVCPNSTPPTSSVVLDHVEWNFGDGSPIVSTTSLGLTHTYSTSNIFHVVAEAFFTVDGVPCSTIAKQVTSGVMVPNPSGAYLSPLASSMNVFCENAGWTSNNYLTVHVLLFNVSLFMDYTAPLTSSTPITFKGELVGTAPGVPANYTFTLDGSTPVAAAGAVSGTGVFTINTSPTPIALPIGQHIAELTVTDRNTTTCPITQTLVFDVLPTEKEPCAYCFTFRPEPGKRYWASAWVKQDVTQVISYPNVAPNAISLDLTFVGSATTFSLYPSGDIIDGWQRIAGEFTVPGSATEINIKLANATGSVTYFDDIRVHPFNANMKSFVNDPDTFWLTAELDDNNYATFYEYDKEGKLIRIKKETSRGIVTTKENRSSNPKTN